MAISVAALVGLLVPAAGAGPVTCIRTEVAQGYDAVGPVVTADGQVWFGVRSDGGSDPALGRRATDGTVTLHELDDNPNAIIVGPDGNVWTAAGGDVQRWSANGTLLSETDDGFIFADHLTVGPDGDVWGIATNQGWVWEITPSLGVTERFVDFGSFNDIAAGADGRVWTVGGPDLSPELRAFSTDGAWDFENPASDDDIWGFDRSFVDVIERGPGSQLWVASSQDLGLVGTGGSVSWVAQTPNSFTPYDLLAADDARLWAYDANQGWASTAGSTTFTDNGSPLRGERPRGLAVDDGQLWATSWNVGPEPRAIFLLRCPEITAAPFTDVALTHPFVAEIAWMAEVGVSTGYVDGTYRPSAAVTRGAMSAFMYRLARADAAAPPTASFSDVPPTHPFFLEVEWMAAEGITTGYAGGTYRPGAAVSRGAMAAFMYRLAGEPDHPDPVFPGPFNDVRETHPFALPISWMSDYGISGGYPDFTFRPGAPVTRAAMSAFMQRLTEVPGTPLNG